jgi:hypothetical protein
MTGEHEQRDDRSGADAVGKDPANAGTTSSHCKFNNIRLSNPQLFNDIDDMLNRLAQEREEASRNPNALFDKMLERQERERQAKREKGIEGIRGN